MTAYFAALVHNESVIVVDGPHETHDAATAFHTQQVAVGKTPGGFWTRTVLLDIGSLPLGDEESLADLVLRAHDPVLAAVFKIGARVGAAEAWARIEGRRDPAEVAGDGPG